MDRIWDYYSQAARRAGTNSRTGETLPFSLEFFFDNTRPQDQNELVRTFLGDPAPRLQPLEPPADDEIRRYTSRVTPLYDEQVQAIARALSYPISLVQGPPGTGKTEMILNLISVILHTRPGATIAIVSTNNEALATIVNEIDKRKEEDPMMAAISEKFAVLGSKSKIRAWRKARSDAGEDVTDIDRRAGCVHSRYLSQYPVFSSTVHSLRKIFTLDPDFDNQFDYVIADECSQMSIMLGIVAMSCAKNIVLIGDNNQLPPVISSEIRTLAAVLPDELDRYREAEEKSFLSLCESLFPEAPNSFLNCHYRCHPSIIDFCNRYVYEGRLAVKTPNDGQFRIRAVWYEGDYCEKISVPVDDGEEESVRRQIYNKRQIEIFIQEELPRLAERLRSSRFTIAVIAPFRHQIKLLGERLREALAAMNLAEDDITETLDEDDIPRLTIHKAQGKGFDVVYLLPVEDYYTGSPWSQRKRLINVAVSRAKQEFCIITSSQWLPEGLQQTLTGYVLPNGADQEPNEEGMYCRKLLQYVADRCPEPQGEFGFHRSGITSVFDLVPYHRRRLPASAKAAERLLSAPAKCVQDALLETFGARYTILRELPLRDIEETRSVPCPDTALLQYRENSRIDFALCQGTSVKLLIEVDGEYHRDYRPLLKRRDKNKNTWINELLQAGDLFLRIPTDGSTEQEMNWIQAKLAAARSSLTVSEDAVRHTQITRTASQAQDTVDLLLRRLERGVDDNLAGLRAFFERTDLSDEEKIRAVRMNYTHAQAMSYGSKALNSFYLCRYAVAYAFEYAMLYDLALRLCLQGGNTTFGVVSFGAGSFLDAWSMAYAKARLTAENPAFDGIKLYYKGVDEQVWDTYFVNPTRVYSDEGNALTPADDPMDEQIDGLFSKVWLYHRDISRFLRDDMGGRFYYNVLVFPKIINELRPGDVAQLAAALTQIEFYYDEYYLLVSHSAYHREDSVRTLKQLIGAINSDGTYDVSCDCHDLLSPDNLRGFERAWLGRDSLVSLSENTDLPLKCYKFRGGSDPLRRRNFGPAPKLLRSRRFVGTFRINAARSQSADLYIKSHNSDFSYASPKQFLRELGERTALVANQITTIRSIVFDVIRLKKRDT